MTLQSCDNCENKAECADLYNGAPTGPIVGPCGYYSEAGAHEGKAYTSGGAILGPTTAGPWAGCVYADPEHNRVTSWDGKSLIIPATFGRPYQAPFCKLQAVSFTHHGRTYTGRCCPDWAQLVRVRETRRSYADRQKGAPHGA